MPRPTAQWALVRGDGTVLAFFGGIAVQHSLGSGVYFLDFGSTVASRRRVAAAAP